MTEDGLSVLSEYISLQYWHFIKTTSKDISMKYAGQHKTWFDFLDSIKPSGDQWIEKHLSNRKFNLLYSWKCKYPLKSCKSLITIYLIDWWIKRQTWREQSLREFQVHGTFSQMKRAFDAPNCCSDTEAQISEYASINIVEKIRFRPNTPRWRNFRIFEIRKCEVRLHNFMWVQSVTNSFNIDGEFPNMRV